MENEQTDLRQEVKWFAEHMESAMKENDHKGGWSNCSFDWLIDRLFKKTNILWQAVEQSDYDRIIKVSAHVANYAMMMADNAKKLK